MRRHPESVADHGSTRPEIQIRLLDFAVSRRRLGSYSYAQCQIYGEIKERLASGLRNITVCGATKRDHVVYTSVGNKLEISLKYAGADDSAVMPYYLFRYEAIGCPDRPLPVGSYAIRQGERLIVKCNYTSDVFHLKCVGTVWVGDLRNCTSTSRKVHVSAGEDLGIPYGLSILIVLAIALVIGLFVLFTGLAFLKNRQRGLCLFRNRRHDNGRGVGGGHLSDAYDKHYVRSPWIQSQDDGTTTIASVGSTKTSPWREATLGGGPHPPPPALVTDLPPCTPLMERGHRPPSYGQVQGQRRRLACGCYVDGNPASGSEDLCDYPSRHEILATACPGNCAAAAGAAGCAAGCAPPSRAAAAGRHLDPERLILKPGDRAQYFVVDATPIYTVRNDVNNPRIQTAAAAANAKPKPGEHLQTDDVKLKLKVTDKPVRNYPAASPCSADDSDKGDQCPESRPLIQNESPSRQIQRQSLTRRQSLDNPVTSATCSVPNEAAT